MLAVREAGDGPQDEDSRQRGQGAHSRMREQPPRLGIGVDDVLDLRVELVDPAGDPRQQFQAVIAPARGVRR
jgi:hypothetical protein